MARPLAPRWLATQRLGIDQRNAETFWHKLRERKSKRSPGKATAGNHDVVGRATLCLWSVSHPLSNATFRPAMRNC